MSQECLSSKVDDVLMKLENRACKLLVGAGSMTFVQFERVEIDFLVLVEQVNTILQEVLRDDQRQQLVQVFGAPYIYLARIRYLLDTIPLSERRVSDCRWLGLGRNCEVVESVLRDLGDFRDWHELQEEGAFVPAFEDPDAESCNSEEEQVLEDDRLEDFSAATESVASLAEAGPSEPSASAQAVMHFAKSPCGRSACIADEGRLLVRSTEDPGFVADMLSSLSALAKNAGISTNAGRVGLYQARKAVSEGTDSGGTAVSAVPIWKFPQVGQFAEVVVESMQEGTQIGCVGIGLTLLGPSAWLKMGRAQKKSSFPRKFDQFPGPSWIFSGPYRGFTRRLYVDGKKSLRYSVGESEAWKTGDRIGILLEPKGRLGLYVNGQNVITTVAPGLETLDVQRSDLWLVAEAYGSVLALSLNPRPDVGHLSVPGASPEAELGKLQTLDEFSFEAAELGKLQTLDEFLDGF